MKWKGRDIYLKEIWNDVVKDVPWITQLLAILAIILMLIIIYKTASGGPKTISLGKFKIEPNKTIQKVQQQFDELNEHSEHKTLVLKLLNQVSVSISEWDSLPPDEFDKKLKVFYDFFLPGIVALMTKQKGNIHRVAIFHKSSEKHLKILHGSGYSPGGLENLELGFYDTKAGYCFINEEYFWNNDITQDSSYKRNPKSSREYKSLVCVPIFYADEVIGILNIDGLYSNSFSKDDIDYITYFANSVSPILYRELLNKGLIKQEEALLSEESV